MKKFSHMSVYYKYLLIKMIYANMDSLQKQNYNILFPDDYINRVRYGELFNIFYETINSIYQQVKNKKGTTKVLNLFDIHNFDDVLNEITKIISYELENWYRYDNIYDLFNENNDCFYQSVCAKSEQLQRKHLFDENEINDENYEINYDNEY